MQDLSNTVGKADTVASVFLLSFNISLNILLFHLISLLCIFYLKKRKVCSLGQNDV